MHCDGKINNNAFKIEVKISAFGNKVSLWVFCIIRANVLNNNRVVKVKYDDKNCVKFNFYKTGSVNIQGATCSGFHYDYFCEDTWLM
jgi:hypothetical protein